MRESRRRIEEKEEVQPLRMMHAGDLPSALISPLDLEKLSRITGDKAKQAVAWMIQDIVAGGEGAFQFGGKGKTHGRTAG
jgi:hypothetical protein